MDDHRAALECAPADAVFQGHGIEIQQQPDLAAAEAQIGLKLGLMHWVKRLNPLLSGQKVNSSNWLQSATSSDRSGVAKIADWIDIFSNTVTENTCSNV